MSEFITAECPHCFATLKIRGENAIGKKARCPKCKEPFIVKPRADELEEVETADSPAQDESDDFMAMLNSAVTDSSKRQAAPRTTRIKGSASKDAPVKKKKVKRQRDDDDGGGILSNLGVFGWILGGMVGGLIGASIWAAIGVATERESGWIAWGVGFLVGLGVRVAAQENYGPAPGITAVLLAIVSITFGKFLIAYFLIDKLLGNFQIEPATPEEAAISMLEDTVEEEFDAQGLRMRFDDDDEELEKNLNAAENKPNAAEVKPVANDGKAAAPDGKPNVPEGQAAAPDGKPKDPAAAPKKSTYTYDDVKAEAKKRWDAMPPEKQQLAKDEATAGDDGVDARMGAAKAFGTIAAFIALMIEPINLLWFGFAGFTAFRVGSGSGAD